MNQTAAKLKHILTVSLILLTLFSGLFILRGYLTGQFDSAES